jgi:transposase-like protein
MTKIPEACAPVKARTCLDDVVTAAESALRGRIELWFNMLLASIVTHGLGRRYHRRRAGVPEGVKCEGACCRCRSRTSQRFSRNGFRRRRLLTRWGELRLELPRVRCECGGSVRLDFGGLLEPYQRIWDDVEEQVRRWGALALSLRQMRRELGRMHVGPLALRTLTQRLHQIAQLAPEFDPKDVPPIVQVDAFWVTLLRPNGRIGRDRKGRKRDVKGRFKCPVFVALGVWPENNRCEVLHWQLGDSEDVEEWVTFLGTLEAEGIRGENGLQLIIHDGGSGLCSALRTVYFGAEQQRCLFHKLRNLYHAIQVTEELTPTQRRRRRKAIFKDFRAIWEADRYPTALRRYLKTVRKYRDSQPEAVATLRRDFRSTVTYYHLERRFPDWERRHLRTTSRLERFNLRLRIRTKAARAYHCERGLMAMVTQEVSEFHAARHDFHRK